MIGKLTEQEIVDFLKDNMWGHLGCNDGFNTYVYPINYFYDGRYIFFHSQAGSKLNVMRQNKRVCFQVEDVASYINWKSVMVHGDILEVDDERERLSVMKSFLDHRLLLKISRSVLSEANDGSLKDERKMDSKPVIYKMLIDEKNGRYENE